MQREQVKIDVSSIPDAVRDDLASATLELVRGILRRPGGREMLDKKTQERRSRSSPLESQTPPNIEPQIEPQNSVLSK